MDLPANWIKALQALIDQDVDTRLIIIDDESIISFANQSAAMWFGAKQHRAIEKPLGGFLPAHFTNEILNLASEALASNQRLSMDVLDLSEGLHCTARAMPYGTVSRKAIAVSIRPLCLIRNAQHSIRSEYFKRATKINRGCLGALSPRELVVFEMVIHGKLTTEVADRLGIRRRTVDCHRAAVRRKLKSDCLRDLVLIGLRAGLLCLYPDTAMKVL